MNRPENMTAERRLKKRLSDSASQMSEERKEKKREVIKMPIIYHYDADKCHKWTDSTMSINVTNMNHLLFVGGAYDSYKLLSD